MSDVDEFSDPEYDVFDPDETCPRGSKCPSCGTPTPSPLFTICKYEDLLKKMEEVIQGVQEMTVGYSKTELRILLNTCKWDESALLEKLTGDEATVKKLYDKAQLPFGKTKTLKKFRKLQVYECDVCLSDYDSSEMFHLDCGHLFCKECVVDTVRQKIYDRQQLIFCPSDHCDCLIPDNYVLDLMTEKKHKTMFQKMITDSYVQTKPNLGWCPGKDCSNVFKIKEFLFTAVDVYCSSPGHSSMCFKCRKAPHEPLDCHMAEVWLGKQLKCSLTEMWIKAFTKNCPNCSVAINKNGGCNHMSCNQCKHEFCWICMKDWYKHDTFRGCNTYRDKHEKWDNSKKSLERYMFYSERYNQQKQSLMLEEKLKSDETVSPNADSETNQKYVKEKNLNNAVMVLKECRMTLMNTYAFAYFLKENNESLIFENNQSDLQKKVEELSGLLERNVHKSKDHTQVSAFHDIVQYCNVRKNKLVEHVKESEAADKWEKQNI